MIKKETGAFISFQIAGIENLEATVKLESKALR